MLIHYPAALNDLPAFVPLHGPPCPRAAKAAREVLSLPLHPRLSNDDAEQVMAAVREVEKGNVLA
jgi:perosamine synthetase